MFLLLWVNKLFLKTISASLINKAIVIFLKEQSLVGQLTDSEVWVQHFKQRFCYCCVFFFLYFLVDLASYESYRF